MPTAPNKTEYDSTASDGNTSQWDKVKQMRDAQAARDRGESTGTPVQVIGIEPPAPETPPAAAVEPPAAEPKEPARDPATGKFVKADAAVPETPKEPAVEEPKKVAPAPETPALPPGMKLVKIDGVEVPVQAELAEAFERAEKINTEAAQVNEKEQLKAELREELRKELAPPPKSDAEIAAERALAEAERLKNAPKKPEAALLITNPEEYEKQRDAYEEWRVEEKLRKAEEKRDADTRAAVRQQAQMTEAQARDTLRVQFYDAYPVLKDSSDLVDVILTAQFDALAASGKLSPENLAKMDAAAREALKKSEFAAAAVTATKRLAKLAHGAKVNVAPPPPPPNTVSSQPKTTVGAKTPTPPAEAPKTGAAKYPKGSISAVLAERKAKLEGRAA